MLTLAHERDIPAILALYRSQIGRVGCTWDEDYPNADIIRDDVAARTLYLLRDESGAPIAAATRVPTPELGTLTCWTPRQHPCEIARIAVTPAMQGKHIAKAMLTELFSLLREEGFDGVRLLVSPNHPAARRLYAGLGFQVCGTCTLYDEHWLTAEMPL